MEWLWCLLGSIIGTIVTIIYQKVSLNRRSVHGKFIIHTNPEEEIFECRISNIDEVFAAGKDYVLLEITDDLNNAPEKQGL